MQQSSSKSKIAASEKLLPTKIKAKPTDNILQQIGAQFNLKLLDFIT